MGRYNNRRTQAAAEALKNTPARARFSKGPQRKNNNARKNSNSKNATSTDNKGGQQQQQRGPRGSNQKQAVVDKMKQRIMDTSSSSTTHHHPPPSSRTASIDQALDKVDITKYDELVLSDHVLTVITNLLTDLGIVNHSNNTTTNNNTNPGRRKGTATTTTTSELPIQEEEEEETNPIELDQLRQQYHDNGDGVRDDTMEVDQHNRRGASSSYNAQQYIEQEDDVDDDEFDQYDTPVRFPVNEMYDWEGGPQDDEGEDQQPEDDYLDDVGEDDIQEGNNNEDGEINDNDNDDDGNDEVDPYVELREDPTFLHLTTYLSFSEGDASRACFAIENWNVHSDNGGSKDKDSSIEGDKKKIMKPKERLSLAMDWLCLHLEESKLTSGFQLNKTDQPNNNNSSITNSGTNQLISRSGIPLVGSGLTRAIPHPSISLAKPITSDKEWTESVRLQERIVKFVRLGFLHSEASAACQKTTNQIMSDTSKSSSSDVESDPGLLYLLNLLEQSSGSDDHDSSTVGMGEALPELNQTDLDYAAEEREQEREALCAIYENQFEMFPASEVVSASSSTASITLKHMDRYVLHITPIEVDADRTGNGDVGVTYNPEQSNLTLFCRPGYPVVQTPLHLFQNPTFPPSLLRRINQKLAIKAQELIGTPAVFELVTFLSESLPMFQAEFIEEQKRERDEERRRQQEKRLAEGSNYDEEYDELGDPRSLSRRQRSKLKAAEKAYQRPEQLEQYHAERRERQAARLQRIQQEESRLRQSMAERVISQRQEEQIQQDAERAARAAMNTAFNRGASVDEARAAAQEARNEVLREHGVTIEEEHIGKDETTEAVASDLEDASPATSENISSTEATPKTSAFMDRLKDTVAKAVLQNPTKSSNSQTEATPTTSAFMDRLRQMYDDAVRAKTGKPKGVDRSDPDGTEDSTVETTSRTEPELDAYHLSDPEWHEGEGQTESRLPRPVAVPTGELADVMKDVITQQQDQPWLVFPEARVPTVKVSAADSPGGDRVVVTPEHERKQREISKNLRQELERKRKSADSWAAENDSKSHFHKPSGGKKNNGFTPQKFHSMMTARQRLPAFQMQQEIVSTIASNQITVIAGDTGCGKTTQVPQLVLDDLIMRNEGAATNIIVTQPRRISAIGVSERIADERCERVGETCGYSIKLEKKMSSKTRLLLCTTGILLRRLQCDPDLAAVSHVFVDEVHERDLNTDFLLIIVKDLLARRKSLKLVLMSATLNSEAFSAYFGGCPVVSIPGRAHPVTENRLEDILELTGYQVQEHSDYALKTSDSRPPRFSKSALRKLYFPKYSKETIHSLSIVDETVINYELLTELLEHITLNNEEGAILVFMPGMMEIQKAIEEMYKKEIFQSSAVAIYPLHSSLSTAEQTAIFEVPPEGVRKIVVSTNIAETSITIEDVVYVVDAGRVKENRRDEMNETPTLVECWVSRASAKQRRGRAGRVRPGIAYHLFSSHTVEHDLQDYQLPEMLRVGIEDLVLQILILDLGEPTTFLRKALNPPSNLAMSNSLKLLETLGAIECKWQQGQGKRALVTEIREISSDPDSESSAEESLVVSSELTALGFHLATLPVDPRVGKMMIYGSLFGCVDPALTIAASMSARSPFVSPFDKRDAADEARKNFATQGSDHLTILNAFEQWKKVLNDKRNRKLTNKEVQTFLHENFLSRLTLNQMEDLRKQFAELLTEIGFLPKGFRLNKVNGIDDAGTDISISPENVNASNIGLLKAVLCAGLYPNIIVAPRTLVRDNTGKTNNNNKKQVGECAFQSHTKGEVYLHPSTINFEETLLDSRYCCFHELVKTSKTYVRDCTTVSPFSLLLFGGALEVYHRHGVCSVDGWLKFRIAAKTASLIKHLRSQMEKILFEKIISPEKDVITGTPEGVALIQSISTLFWEDQRSRVVAPSDRSGGEIVRPWTGMADENSNSNNNNKIRNSNRTGGGRGRRQEQQQQTRRNDDHTNANTNTNRDNNNQQQNEGGNSRGGGRGRGGRGGRGRGGRGGGGIGGRVGGRGSRRGGR